MRGLRDFLKYQILNFQKLKMKDIPEIDEVKGRL